MHHYFESSWECILQVRNQNPLVTLFTNTVTSNLAANVTLAIGGSPIVTTAIEEIPDIMKQTHSFLLNMGTPDATWIDIAKEALSRNERQIPIIFDPVGVGFSQWRNNIAKSLMEHSIANGIHVIRGNASEIVALAKIMGYNTDNEHVATKGVDSSLDTIQALPSARILSQKHSCIVMISGEVDYITNSSTTVRILGGNVLMPTITGMGCSLTACIATMCAVQKDILQATIAGAILFSAIGSKVGSATKQPASFVQSFWDSLFNATLEDLSLFCSVEEVK